MNRIAVLMACHNRKEKTINCLTHLFQQEGIDSKFTIDVFLVNDGSSDGTEKAVKEQFPKVNIIQGNGNLYWNRGMYTAWEVSSKQDFDSYVWLNDDTNLYPHAISELVNSADQTDLKAIICGMIESPFAKNEITYGGGNYVNNKYVMNNVAGKIEQCEVINGNCVLVPRYAFKIVGNLDWTFKHAIGDNDYSLRAKKMSIPSYTTGKFVGSCELHSSLPKWCQPEVPFYQRLKHLYSPLGNHPIVFFRYELRHFGFTWATKHLLSTHLRVLFPSKWIK